MKHDEYETAFLKAIYAEDPDSENWIWPMMVNAEGLGAEQRLAVAKRLKQRKLLDSNGRMSATTGVALTEKGREEAAKLCA